MSASLLWQRRALLATLTPRPDAAGGPICLLFGGLWGLSHRAGIAEVAQFAAIGVMQGMVIGAFGWRFYRRLPTPFLTWLLMVPSGAVLLPALQLITARMAAHALDLVGIPAFADGSLIEVPSSDYWVAPGCAGLNFLLASLTLGIAFADQTYRDAGRRLACVAALLLLAVIGNILRVTLIIAVAHWSHNIGDIVDDHLLYGWGFYLAITLAALAVGQKFRQAPAAPPPAEAPPGRQRRFALITPLCLVAVPLILAAGDRNRGVATPIAALPLECGDFAPDPTPPPLPADGTVDARAALSCATPLGPMTVTAGLLLRPLRDGKLAGLEQRGLAPGRLIDQQVLAPEASGVAQPVLQQRWAFGAHSLTVWSLFWADGAWRRPGPATLWADLASDLRGRRRSLLLQLGLAADPDSAAPLLRRYLATARRMPIS